MVAHENLPVKLTKDFINKRAPNFHPAFQDNSHFNPTSSQYEPSGVSPADTHDLEEILKQYQNVTSDQPGFQFDFLACTWTDVLRELRKAKEAASESNQQGKKLHRKIWRTLGNSGVNVLTPGLSALPNNLSILQGGLAVVFSIARQRSIIRQKILHTFEDIPVIIMMAFSQIETIPSNHPRSEQFRKAVIRLQKTLLSVITDLIKRLNPETIFENVLNHFRSVDIDDLLAMVRTSSDLVRVCGQGVLENIALVTHQTGHDTFKTSQKIYNITQRTDGEVGELRGKMEELLEQSRELQLSVDVIAGKNSLFGFLMDYFKYSEPRQPRPGEETPSFSEVNLVHETGASVTPVQLLNLMDMHGLGALDIEHHILRRGCSMDDEAISHAKRMFETSQVRNLMHSPGSNVVLVNTCIDRAQHTKVSPMSYVCATLARALRRSPEPNIVFAFFCAQDSTSKNYIQGPEGLMRSLVSFLVQSLVQNKYISELDPIYFPHMKNSFEKVTFCLICQTFSRLVKLVPKGVTLYCVLDGISSYEIEKWENDYVEMMGYFGRIIEDGGDGHILKLLLTSPSKSRWLSTLLPPNQMVSLRRTRGK